MPVLHACLECGALTPDTRCPAHAKAKRRNRYARQDAQRRARGKRNGSTYSYRKAREKALARDGHRCIAIEEGRRCPKTSGLTTHHVNGNPRDDREENLATLCKRHHEKADEALAARRRKRSLVRLTGIVSLVGAPGTGKTTLGAEVATRLEMPFGRLDDFGPRGQALYRWEGLMRWLSKQHGVAMVESNVIEPLLSEAFKHRPHLVIELRAPTKLRLQRLEQRGESPSAVQRMRKVYPVGYRVDHVLEPDARQVDRAERIIRTWQSRLRGNQ